MSHTPFFVAQGRSCEVYIRVRVDTRKLVHPLRTGAWYDRKASTIRSHAPFTPSHVPDSSCKNHRVSRKHRDLVRRRSRSLPVLCRVEAGYKTRRNQAVTYFSKQIGCLMIYLVRRRVCLSAFDISHGNAAGSYRAIAKALCSSSSMSPMHTWRLAGRVVPDMADLLGYLSELIHPASRHSLPWAGAGGGGAVFRVYYNA